MTSDFIQSLISSPQHAFAVLGEPTVVAEALVAHLPANSPDVWVEVFDTFTIEGSKKVKSWQSTKPLADSHKYAVWGITSSNMEAQNALLKVLEEPATDTKIFIVIPHEGILLPTVLSRLVVVRPEGEKSGHIKEAQKFLQLEPHERLEFLTGRFNYDSNTIKAELLSFLSACEWMVSDRLAKGEKVNSRYLEIIEAKKNISGRSAVPRLVMEHLATVL